MLRSVLIFMTVAVISLLPMNSFSGDLDPPGTPFDAVSAMYSLEDIYYRLASGLPGEKRTGTFTEPASDPQSGSGYTLDDIMTAAPSADNTKGAVPGDVIVGRKYWGLRTDGSGWGMLTGTMKSRTISSGSSGLEAGYYEATHLDAIDLDLAAGNIKSGVNIFGIGGTILEATGDAAAEHVLMGRTFSRAGAVGLNGTMVNPGAVSLTPGTADITIVEGYHNGAGTVYGDTDLVSGNIKSGVAIFDVVGADSVVDTSSGDATAVDILTGKKAWVDGNEVTGNIPTHSLSNAGVDVEAGYYTATALDTVDADLTAQNIRNGVTLFGVAGTFNGVTCAGSLSLGGRWCNNGDGTVTDMTTGLIWLRDAGCFGEMVWADAIAEVLVDLKDGDCSLTDGSALGDWRLPTLNELNGLTRGSEAVSDSLPQIFNNVQSVLYWSRTTDASVTDNAGVVSMAIGFTTSLPKDQFYQIWPVRRHVIPGSMTTFP